MNKRYWVITKSGRKFCVEEIGYVHTEWGNINPATKKLEKVEAKNDDIIDETNSQITPDKFKTICYLAPGTSPLAYIDALEDLGVERIELDVVNYI